MEIFKNVTIRSVAITVGIVGVFLAELSLFPIALNEESRVMECLQEYEKLRFLKLAMLGGGIMLLGLTGWFFIPEKK